VKIKDLNKHVNAMHENWVPCLFSLCTAWFDCTSARARHLINSHPKDLVKKLPASAFEIESKSPGIISNEESTNPNNNLKITPKGKRKTINKKSSETPSPSKEPLVYSLRKRKDTTPKTEGANSAEEDVKLITHFEDKSPKRKDGKRKRGRPKLSDSDSDEEWKSSRNKKSPKKKKKLGKSNKLAKIEPDLSDSESPSGTSKLSTGFGEATINNRSKYAYTSPLSKRRCYVCGCHVGSDMALTMHLKVAHPKVAVRCLLCQRWYENERMRDHMINEHGESQADPE